MLVYSILVLLLSSVSVACRSATRPVDSSSMHTAFVALEKPSPWMTPATSRIQENDDDIFVLFMAFSADLKKIHRTYGPPFWVVFRTPSEQALWQSYLKQLPDTAAENPPKGSPLKKGPWFWFSIVQERSAYNSLFSFYLIPQKLSETTEAWCDVSPDFIQDLLLEEKDYKNNIIKENTYCPSRWQPVFARQHYTEIWRRPSPPTPSPREVP